MNSIRFIKQDLILFGAECRRALKLLKVYPLDTINSIVSFVIVSIVFMIGIEAIGDSSQAFGVVFFPIMLNLIGGPSSSIRNDIEMGVFEQVYISKYSLIKVAVIRTIVAGLGSIIGSILIAVVLHFFFVKITFSFVEVLILFMLFGIQSLLIGIILAGITLRFRKTETLLNSINILIMVILVLPLFEISKEFMYLPSILCPFWGVVTYYQQLLVNAPITQVYINLIFSIINTSVLAIISYFVYNKLMTTTKLKGYLGQY